MPVKKTAKKKATKKKVAKKKTVKRKPVPKKTTKKKATKRKTAPKKKTVKKKVVKKKTAKKAAPKKTTKKKTPVKKKVVSKAKRPQSARTRKLKQLLIKRRNEILKEAQEEISKYISGENRQLVETALDDGDWSVIDLSEDISFRRLGAHKDTLRKIDESLRKINEGTYGTCDDCEEDINAERLRVLPFAIYCRDCQEQREELEAAERWEGVTYTT